MKLTLSLLCLLDYDGGRHDLALVSVASGQIQTLVSFTEPPHTASLSPDDRFVVYDQPSDRAHDWDLYIVSTHGRRACCCSIQRTMSVRSGYRTAPRWRSRAIDPAPPQLTYRLFAVSARGGAPRSMAVSIPGFAWDHDLQIDPTGTVAAFDHFSRARVAELWVLRHLTHPLD
jgi:hypothetical protein